MKRSDLDVSRAWSLCSMWLPPKTGKIYIFGNKYSQSKGYFRHVSSGEKLFWQPPHVGICVNWWKLTFLLPQLTWRSAQPSTCSSSTPGLRNLGMGFRSPKWAFSAQQQGFGEWKGAKRPELMPLWRGHTPFLLLGHITARQSQQSRLLPQPIARESFRI